eukprot:Em0735g4a
MKWSHHHTSSLDGAISLSPCDSVGPHRTSLFGKMPPHTIVVAQFEKQPPDNMRKSNFFNFEVQLFDSNSQVIEICKANFNDFYDSHEVSPSLLCKMQQNCLKNAGNPKTQTKVPALTACPIPPTPCPTSLHQASLYIIAASRVRLDLWRHPGWHSGNDFFEGLEVVFGTLPASCEVLSPNAIAVRAPQSPRPGEVDITLTFKGSQFCMHNPGKFLYISTDDEDLDHNFARLERILRNQDDQDNIPKDILLRRAADALEMFYSFPRSHATPNINQLNPMFQLPTFPRPLCPHPTNPSTPARLGGALSTRETPLGRGAMYMEGPPVTGSSGDLTNRNNNNSTVESHPGGPSLSVHSNGYMPRIVSNGPIPSSPPGHFMPPSCDIPWFASISYCTPGKRSIDVQLLQPTSDVPHENMRSGSKATKPVPLGTASSELAPFPQFNYPMFAGLITPLNLPDISNSSDGPMTQQNHQDEQAAESRKRKADGSPELK